MKSRRLAVVGKLMLAGLLMLVVWVLLVWVASRPALKVLVDLTPQRINSVDPATEDLMRELRAQKIAVEFHWFVPPIRGQAPDDYGKQMLVIRDRVIDLTRILLRRYEWLGGEGVAVHEYGFYGDNARTREAVQAFDYKPEDDVSLVVAVRPEGKERRFRKLSWINDLSTIDLPGVQQSPAPGAKAVPVLKDYVGETQISSTLKSLLVQGTPIAYVMRGPDVDLKGAAGNGYADFLAGLGQAGFEVREWKFEGSVPADASLVIALEPRRDLSDREADALFAWVKRGGRVFLNYGWAGLPDWNPTGARFGELLGFEIGPSLVCHLIADVGGRAGGRGIDGPGVEKLQLFANPSHPVTRRTVNAGRSLEIAGAREIKVRDGAPSGMRREPLLRTGPEGWLAAVGPDGRPDLRQPRDRRVLRDFCVGMSIDVDAEPTGNAKEPPRQGQVVIVSGVFCNNTGLRLFGDLAFNICNWLTERRVLLDIAGSRYEARHLSLQPQQLTRVRWLLLAGVPGTFLVLGCFVLWRRRRV